MYDWRIVSKAVTVRCLCKSRQEHNRRNQALLPIQKSHEMFNKGIKLLRFSGKIGKYLTGKVIRQGNRSTKQTYFFYRFDRSIENDRIPHASDRIKRAIELSRKVEESHLTNCDQLITGLLVVFPLLKSTCGNPFPVVRFVMLCQTKRYQTCPRTESID